MRHAARTVKSMLPLLLLAGATALGAGADPVTDAENLVREVYYEGIPYEATQELTDPAVARLGAMLREPAERPSHGNVVLVLGMSGHPDAFALLEEYARRPLSGEVDRATFRARTRVAQAMGHLARSDDRAMRWLLREARRSSGAPAWHFRHHRGQALTLLLEEQVLTGLALSGAPQADALLRNAADASDPRRRRHAEQARNTHQRMVEERTR